MIQRLYVEWVEAEDALQPTAIVSGEIRFAARGGPPVDIGTAVVYLRPRGRVDRTRGSSTVRVTSAREEFSPPPTLLRPGQRVELVNRGPLVHRVFTSQLDEGPFELAPGESSEPFPVRERGPVRFYCSLHADETFVLYVEDARHASVVGESGEFEFADVEAGRYTLAIWSERVSGPVRDVFVDGFTRKREPIWLFANLIDP